jgi:hypothetical protein
MLGVLKAWFTALSTTAKVGVVTAAVVTGGVASSATQHPARPTQVKTATSVSTCTPLESTKTETETIPFDKTTVNDSNTAQGKTYIQIAGVDGVKTITYDVTQHSPSGCKEDIKKQVKEEVTTPAITEVTAIGTYVAPAVSVCANGSYTNVDGVQVCSPSATNTGGATAICVDGTYSYSLHHSGTCSHHGGVAQWL